MNIDQLRGLAELSKTGSINTAAKKLFVSQQALSESIKRLETELDCTILNRSKTGVEFTDDGKLVLDCAVNILERYETLRTQLDNRQRAAKLTGRLSLGIAPMAARALLTTLLDEMRRSWPGITIFTQEYGAETILQLLRDERLDFGLFAYSADGGTLGNAAALKSDEFQTHLLYIDRLVCVMAKNNPFSVHKSVSMAQVYGQKQSMYEYDFSAHDIPSVLHVSNNTSIHQQLMQKEGTVCIMPHQAFLSLYPQKEFICRPLIDARPLYNYLVWPREIDEAARSVQQAFIDTVLSLTPQYQAL